MHPSITSIYGDPGTIKTSLTLTWPPPIAFYNLEGGAARAWGYAEGIEDGSITERVFPLPTKSLTERWAKLTGHSEVWQAFTAQLEADFKSHATIVLDTGTMVWALCRDAYLQEIQAQNPGRKQLLQIEYGEPNRRMNGLYSLARAFQKNLVVTHHETDEYMQVMDPFGKPVMSDGTPLSVTTGNRLPEGFKQTLALSDWVLHTTLEAADDGDVPVARVEKSGYGLRMRGKRLWWPTYAGLEAEVNAPQEVSDD